MPNGIRSKTVDSANLQCVVHWVVIIKIGFFDCLRFVEKPIASVASSFICAVHISTTQSQRKNMGNPVISSKVITNGIIPTH